MPPPRPRPPPAPSPCPPLRERMGRRAGTRGRGPAAPVTARPPGRPEGPAGQRRRGPRPPGRARLLPPCCLSFRGRRPPPPPPRSPRPRLALAPSRGRPATGPTPPRSPTPPPQAGPGPGQRGRARAFGMVALGMILLALVANLRRLYRLVMSQAPAASGGEGVGRPAEG